MKWEKHSYERDYCYNYNILIKIYRLVGNLGYLFNIIVFYIKPNLISSSTWITII